MHADYQYLSYLSMPPKQKARASRRRCNATTTFAASPHSAPARWMRTNLTFLVQFFHHATAHFACRPHSRRAISRPRSFLFRPIPTTLALHRVYLHAMVSSSRVSADRRLLRAGDGPVGLGVRVLRDYQPIPVVSRDQ